MASRPPNLPTAAPGAPAPRAALGSLTLALLLSAAGCGGSDPARETVQQSIRAHGGDAFERMDLAFDFRDARFTVRRDGGRFHYERTYVAENGSTVVEWMDNAGTGRSVGGVEVPLDDAERRSVETAVNSVVYFSFLPFRLLDEAARIRDLGTVEVEGRPYRKVEVTFDPDGGGVDWEDRFVYWFHRDHHTLDYLAYRYHRDGGGTRFRRAVNRREVAGLLLQDYENFTAASDIGDIAEYDRYLEEGRLTLVSSIALENVRAPAGEPLAGAERP